MQGNRTVIIEAINSKNVKAVKILLAAGCSVNAVASKSGKTALAHAVEDW